MINKSGKMILRHIDSYKMVINEKKKNVFSENFLSFKSNTVRF